MRNRSHAIDEHHRVKRQGTLSWYRLAGGREIYPTLDQDPVVETVVVILRTPSDPQDGVVQEVNVEWVPHFANGALAPRLRVQAGASKMLALFPHILIPLLAMKGGELSPEAFIAGLEAMGIGADVSMRPHLPFVSPASTCTVCQGLFAPMTKESPSIDDAQQDRPSLWRCAWCVHG